MGTLRFLGTFLADPVNVPVGVIAYLASQLSIADPQCIVRYAERLQTQQDHAQEIRQHSGYTEFADRCGGFALMRFLYARIWVGTERPSVLFDLATAWLLDKKVLLPGVTTLTRLISTVRERVAERLWQRLSATVSPEQRTDLEDTLILTGLDKVEEPESLQLLRHSVARRQPLVDLPELLLEIQARTGFASEFSHISEARSRLDDLPTSICAVLLAEACNVGLTPMARKGIPALERDRLLYVQQNYIRAYMLLGIGGYGIIGISNGRGGDMPTFTDPESIEWYRYPVLAENPHGKQWIKSEALLGLAPNTIDAYARGVNDFLEFCQRADVNLLTASKGDLARYVGDLRQRPGPQKTPQDLLGESSHLSNATLQQRITAVRLFFDFLVEEHMREENPVGRGRYTPGPMAGLPRGCTVRVDPHPLYGCTGV